MAYRLTVPRSVDKDLSRIVHRQLEKAVGALSSHARDANGIHDARTAIKKIRAILRMLQFSLGKTYRTSNERLRSIAHQLSSSSDAAAVIEVMEALHRHYPDVVNDVILVAVRKGLVPRQHAATARLRPAVMQRELADVARVLPRRVRHVADRAIARAGTVQGYSRARDALRQVRAEPEDGLFHAWRRRVKDHWYQVRLMEAMRPSIRPRIALLKRLETLLGDDHNLVVLRATLLAAPARFGDAHATAVVLGCIAKYQATLRKQALKLGERLFLPASRSFGRSLRARRGRES